jgi:thioredoxin 1
MSATIKVTDDSFKQDVLNADVPVLVDFWAEWCGPCKMIAPGLEELADSMKDKVKVVKLNIDDNPETPTKYGVRGIPTLMLFKDGVISATKIGALPKAQLETWLKSVL